MAGSTWWCRVFSIVSVLFNEPKLLKFRSIRFDLRWPRSFSALQRAEIAEIVLQQGDQRCQKRFSALQRAEIAEMMSRVLRW